ncbi:hypothetical protein N431DRAFT_454220 [Stipitochalara longipes BDJ]|nr:hypothetical protein N431DRAFT_454220 [Stipitochalara longipes BDJ]
MNWTGGRLSRHSGTSNPVKDRQKQHFAKVQQTLRSDPKKHSPIKWSFFDHIAENRGRIQQESSAPKHRGIQVHKHRESHTTQQHHGYYFTRYGIQRSSSRQSSPSLALPHRRLVLAPVKQQHGRVLDDDLYNATPPLRESKRKREDLTAVSELENVAHQGEEESLSDKRRKVLRKGDWVGVSIQQPLRVAFISPEKEENIGRRRKVTDGHRARYSSRQLHITSPFSTNKRLLVNQRSSQERLQEREPPRADVRISIGGRVVPPGVSSSSAPCRMGSHSTTTHKRPHTTSSDIMLLDANISVTQGSPLVVTNNLVAFRYPTSGAQIDHTTQVFSPNDTAFTRWIGQVNHMPYEDGNIGSGLVGVFSETAWELQQKNQDQINHQNNSEPLAKSRRNAKTPAPENNNIRGRLIFSSSTASIHHPAPRSSRVSTLLRSASSDIAESTMGQVGKNKPVIPRSQILENEIWETWIAPEQDYGHSSDYLDFNEHVRSQRVSISPGVSAYHAHWHANSVADDEGDERSFELQGPDFEEVASGSQRSSAPVSRKSDELGPLNSELAQRDIKDMEEESLKAISPQLPASAFTEEDQNESWIKFLFGGIGDKLNATPPPQESTAMTVRKAGLFRISIPAQDLGTEPAISDPNKRLRGGFTSAALPSISRRTFRITEASPCPSDSRHRQAHAEMVPVVYPSPWHSGINAKVEKGSILATSSVSLPIQPTSQSSASEIVDAANLYRPQKRKVTFTRPKPFIGRRTNLDVAEQSESLQIGRGLMERDGSFQLMREGNRDTRYLLGADDHDESEDIESIEDD